MLMVNGWYGGVVVSDVPSVLPANMLQKRRAQL